jgi:hypothetical protein
MEELRVFFTGSLAPRIGKRSRLARARADKAQHTSTNLQPPQAAPGPTHLRLKGLGADSKSGIRIDGAWVVGGNGHGEGARGK